ncbi:MAG TPA: hypothetical protein ACFYD1_00465 [Candidatus Hypogeohydataceae bacterium YC38]|nr:hypothetical protein [Candidatus Brocadiales bacterium]
MAKVRRSPRRKGLKPWGKAEISRLKTDYPKTDTKVLAKRLGRSLEAVRFKAKKLRIKKTKGYMESLYARARDAMLKRPKRRSR